MPPYASAITCGGEERSMQEIKKDEIDDVSGGLSRTPYEDVPGLPSPFPGPSWPNPCPSPEFPDSVGL